MANKTVITEIDTLLSSANTSATKSALTILGAAVTGTQSIVNNDISATAAISSTKIAGLGTAAAAASTDFATAAQGTLATNAQPLLKGVIVTKANGTRTSYPPSADTDVARGQALEAAFASATAGDTIDLSSGNYLISKQYLGVTTGGWAADFQLLQGMTVRLNGARLYKSYTTTNATNLIAGNYYTIITQGTSDFTLVGASSNSSGIIFQASSSTPGTGTVVNAVTVMFAVPHVTGLVGTNDWSLIGPGILEGGGQTVATLGYANEIGLNVNASRRWRIDNVTMIKFRGTGLQLNSANNTGDPSGYLPNKTSTGHVSGCNFDFNNVGVGCYSSNEYTCFSNCTFNVNLTGLIVNAGNTKFIGCESTANTNYALFLGNGNNDGHGCWVGGFITHNLSSAIYAEANMDNGFLFDSSVIAGSPTVNHIESRGGGLSFINCYIDCLFKAGAVPTGVNAVTNCFFPQLDIQSPATVLADLSSAERLRWKFINNHSLAGPWGGDDAILNIYADNAAALGTASTISITSIVASVINGVMTATVTTASAHGISVAASINISGATGTGVLPNGVQNVTVTGASTLTFPLATSAQTFSGTITATKLLMPGEQYRTSTGEVRIVY